MMNRNRRWKLLGAGIVLFILIDGFCFAPALGGMKLFGRDGSVDLASLALLMVTAAVITGLSYFVFSGSAEPSLEEQLAYQEELNVQDILRQIDKAPVKCFCAEQNRLRWDVGIFEEKYQRAVQLAKTSFGDHSLTTIHTQTLLSNLKKTFFDSVHQILNRMSTLDYEDYVRLLELQESKRLEPYELHIARIKEKMQDLDTILVQLDSFNGEMLNLQETGSQKLEQSDALHELQQFVENTRFYQ